MKAFMARQPVFDLNVEAVGYKLLFRNGTYNSANFGNGYEATIDVIRKLIVNFGVKKISNNKRIFINFNEVALFQKAPELFCSRNLVIELSSDIVLSEELLDLIKVYKNMGYLIAVEEYIFFKDKELLGKLVDIVKVDFMTYKFEEISEITEKLKNYKLVLFAERVETIVEHEYAKKIGFTLFQGYFFQRPVILESEEITSIPGVYLELSSELNSDEVDFDKLAGIIKRDTNLSYSFLKLVNSAAFRGVGKVNSIENALVRLGRKESKNLILINIMKQLVVEGTPNELVSLSLKRAKFAELLAPFFNMDKRRGQLFMLGMFSLINLLLRKTMQDVLSELPIGEDIRAALLGDINELSRVLEVVILHEINDDKELEQRLNKLDIDIDLFNDLYMDALMWADELN